MGQAGLGGCKMVNDAPRLLTVAQVAARLGIATETLYRTIRRLRDDHGFPRPLPGLSHRYDPLAIDAWIARWRAEAPRLPEDPDNLAKIQAEIDRRADALGRKERAG